jgi:hypothetical protein
MPFVPGAMLSFFQPPSKVLPSAQTSLHTHTYATLLSNVVDPFCILLCAAELPTTTATSTSTGIITQNSMYNIFVCQMLGTIDAMLSRKEWPRHLLNDMPRYVRFAYSNL